MRNLAYRAAVGLFFLCIGLLAGSTAFFVVWYAAVPFKPVTSYSYNILPETACPGGTVRVGVNREISGEYGRLKEFRLNEDWTTVDVEGYRPNTVVYERNASIPDVSPDRRRVVPSPAIQRAPLEPGVWTITVNPVMMGTQLGFIPRTQSYTYRADSTITVLPEDDPRCGDEDVDQEPVEEVALSLNF